MRPPFCCRSLFSLLLAALCCSCSTPEERADAAFSELCSLAEQVRNELASVEDRESADRAAPGLEAVADELREVLSELDELAQDAGLHPEARRRVGQRYHAPLRAAVAGALAESERIVLRHAFWQSRALECLARREYAHYCSKGVHPWPRAVYAGREYREKK